MSSASAAIFCAPCRLEALTPAGAIHAGGVRQRTILESPDLAQLRPRSGRRLSGLAVGARYACLRSRPAGRQPRSSLPEVPSVISRRVNELVWCCPMPSSIPARIHAITTPAWSVAAPWRLASIPAERFRPNPAVSTGSSPKLCGGRLDRSARCDCAINCSCG